MFTNINENKVWRAVSEKDKGVALIKDTANRTIASVDCGHISIIANVDNALLLAAAPKMFKACHKALVYLSNFGTVSKDEAIELLKDALGAAYGD